MDTIVFLIQVLLEEKSTDDAVLAILERVFSYMGEMDTMVSENRWYKILNQYIIIWGDIFYCERGELNGSQGLLLSVASVVSSFLLCALLECEWKKKIGF